MTTTYLSSGNKMFSELRLAAMSSILLIFTVLIMLTSNHRSDAGLIHIYHKLSGSKPTSEQHSNLTGTSESSINQQSQADHSTSPTSSSSAFELHSSPMQKIMDLIGHHSPVIVLNSEDGTSTTASKINSNDQHQTPSTSSDILSNNNNQLIEQPLQQQQQQMSSLTAQQQQLIQSSVPYEQYYTFTPSHFANDQMQLGNQIALLSPGNGLFSQASGPSSLSSVTNGGQLFDGNLANYNPASIQSQQSQHQQSMLQQQHQDHQQANQVQPVFLSSYIPEFQMRQMENSNRLVPTSWPSNNQFLQYQQQQSMAPQLQQQQPNSIQQIQRQQGVETESSSNSSPKGRNKSGSSSSSSGENDSTQDDEQELAPDDTKTTTASDDQLSEDESSKPGKRDDENSNGLSSGVSSFEDKYDSDQDTGRSKFKFKTEASTMTPNGLIRQGLTDDCMQCICRASSGCDDSMRCLVKGQNEKFCGPFHLTEDYWKRAGSLGDSANNFSSFEDCANDIECAVETVGNYMVKYHRDCDGDGNITCIDYARLHRLHPDECTDSDKLVNEFDEYWAKFQLCDDSYSKSKSGDDEDI